MISLFTACGTARKFSFSIDKNYPAKSFNSRVRFLVMHYTALDFESSLRILTQQGVSAHYLVPQTPLDKKNKLFLLVSEHDRAWHAGVSSWQGRSNLNDTSIGIEIVNLGYKDEPQGRLWFPFTPYQIQMIKKLAKDIIDRYKIHPTAIVGHSDIAPGRKQDPGILFPWKQLYQAGIGAWYDEDRVKELHTQLQNQELNILKLQQDLKKYGYALEESGILDERTEKVIQAFQMHFRPSDHSGVPDTESLAILKNLLEKYF
ncbi:N-acetylmuramoyl-L-alanine amidase [Bacteroidetes bacterium endosymbiont of Geopemphigus sp.]|uniref:N-acetylmuramoyl-L-alanine amidase n=1 Tax=Bacteroidetes bacterium endosymbiont of Geopemphigus sp. TaxID=2047937 RepID=UPI001F4DAD9C|nr:N-acetylmuramoyl-L-alanine amidase [Bacteroidetes bacterium endosymbiont of Geopemphigus sp.]